MLKGVIFDMDGVIIDSHPAHREAWRTFLLTLDRTVSDAELDFVLDGRKRDEILRHFLGELSDVQVREYGNRKDEFFRKASLQLKLVLGVVDFLSSVQNAGIAMGVATSASESRTRHTLESLQLLDKFEVIVTGNDVALGKPDPSIYSLACTQLNVAPGSALAIEDAVSGIRAARCAGLTCIAVASHQSRRKLRAAGAAQVIQNFVGLSLRDLELLHLSQSVSVPCRTALSAQ
jgi:HAD superfamily hydrolase (TIGR01509 family)